MKITHKNKYLNKKTMDHYASDIQKDTMSMWMYTNTKHMEKVRISANKIGKGNPKRLQPSRYWFSHVQNRDVNDACFAMKNKKEELSFGLIGKENMNGYHKCALIYKKPKRKTTLPKIFTKELCQRVRIFGKGKRQDILRELIGKVKEDGVMLEIGTSPLQKETSHTY